MDYLKVFLPRFRVINKHFVFVPQVRLDGHHYKKMQTSWEVGTRWRQCGGVRRAHIMCVVTMDNLVEGEGEGVSWRRLAVCFATGDPHKICRISRRRFSPRLRYGMRRRVNGLGRGWVSDHLTPLMSRCLLRLKRTYTVFF